ncbi:MAG TPA: hypothetical protein VIM55_08095 [Mucilaginibacter sp.]
MFYSEILDALYNKGISDVVKILNTSIHSTNLNKLDNELFIIHTGFSFVTHKGKEMELYAGFSTTSNKLTIIRQPRANWSYKWVPLINGLFFEITARNNYLNKYNGRICDSIDEVNNDYHFQFDELNYDTIINIDPNRLTEELGLFEITTNGRILKFRRSKQLKQPIYLDGVKFSVTQPVENDKDDSDDRQSLGNYLRDDYDDDAETAFWNID